MKKLLAFACLLMTGTLLTAQPVLYFIDNGGIERARTDGTQRQVVLPASLIRAKGIAIDVENERLYWTDWIADKIQTARLDGTQITDLVTTGLDLPEGIALDTAGGKMYWVDSGIKKVQRANFDGSMVQDLVTYLNVNLDDIALDLAGGKMYWTDWGAGAAVGRGRRANLDGTQVQDLITIPNGILLGIDLDLAAGKMYWTNGGLSRIQRANLDGSQLENLITNGLSTPNSLALDLAEGKMYWTDLGTKKLQRANLDGSQVEDLIVNLTAPEGVALTLCQESGAGCLISLPTALDPPAPEAIRLFPNPVRDRLVVQGLLHGDRIQIRDLLGRTLAKLPVSHQALEVDLAAFPPGVYALHILRGGVWLASWRVRKE